VAGEPGFGAAVADGVDGAVAAAAWGVFADCVAEAGRAEWLVEGSKRNVSLKIRKLYKQCGKGSKVGLFDAGHQGYDTYIQ